MRAGARQIELGKDEGEAHAAFRTFLTVLRIAAFTDGLDGYIARSRGSVKQVRTLPPPLRALA